MYWSILVFNHKRTSGSKSLQSAGIVHIGVWENKNVYDEIIPEEMGFPRMQKLIIEILVRQWLKK